MSLLNRIRANFWIRLVPFAVYFLFIRLLSYIIQPYHSYANAILVYEIFIGLLILALIIDFLIASFDVPRPWIVKFIFTLLFGITFLPVLLVLGSLGALVIWFSLQFKENRVACIVTSALGSLSMLTVGIFVVQKGNIDVVRKIPKAIIVANHRSSGDYFIASILSPTKNWRVMIGKNLWKEKIFSWFFSAVGVPIVREKEATIERSRAVLKTKDFLNSFSNAAVTVYIEGTRNRNKNVPMLPFHDGAFRIACDLNIPIVPVVIVGTNNWRHSGPQDTTSYIKQRKNAKVSLGIFFAKVNKLLYRVFKEGINPTVVKVYYLDPVQTIHRTVEEVKDETFKIMEEAYIKYAKLPLEF